MTHCAGVVGPTPGQLIPMAIPLSAPIIGGGPPPPPTTGPITTSTPLSHAPRVSVVTERETERRKSPKQRELQKQVGILRGRAWKISLLDLIVFLKYAFVANHHHHHHHRTAKCHFRKQFPFLCVASTAMVYHRY